MTTVDWSKPIQTRLGKPARLLGEIRSFRPKAIAILYTGHEVLDAVYADGKYIRGISSAFDIVNVPVHG